MTNWRDRVEKPLDLLRQQVSDEHPRVRLEAVRALSFFGSQAAIDVAVESLVFDQDDYLKYTFKGRTGDALMFGNVSENGAPDPMSLHAGLPPRSGEKWLLSQWVRNRHAG